MTDIPDLPPVLERLLPAGYHAQIGAYALDSLPAEERIAFEAHLRECVACQDELPTLLDAARILREAIVPGAAQRDAVEAPTTTPEPPTWVSAKRAQIGEETAPTPSAPVEKEETAEEPPASESPSTDAQPAEEPIDADVAAPQAPVEADAEEQPDSGEATTPEDVPTTLEPLSSSILLDLPDADAEHADLIAAAAARAPGTAEAPVSRRRRPRGRIAPGAQPSPAELAVAGPAKPSRLPWILGGLGLLFGIGSIVAALALAESKNNLEEEIAFQNTQIEELNAQRDAYLAQTTAITWQLQPTTLGTPGSGGTVFADPAGASALLSVFGMPGLGAEQQYQVWYVLPDDSSVPGPSLTMDNGASVAQLAPDLSPYRAIAVTIEPAGGSELPSTNPVLQGFFTS